MVTYLVSNQTGNHTIFGNCSSSFTFYTHLLDGYRHASTIGSSPKYTTELRSGFRYKITAEFSHRPYCRIGVIFPDGKISDPLGYPYIYRTFDLYRRNYFYFQQLYNISSLKLNNDSDKFLWENPLSFSANASSYMYKSGRIESRASYATIITGSIWVSTHDYSFGLSCNSSCIFNVTQNGDKEIFSLNGTGNSDIKRLYGYYCISFRCWGEGVLTLYRHFNGSKWKYDPYKMAFYPYGRDLSHRIVYPTMTTINTTAISVGITSTSYLYPKDRWSPDGRYEIACYEYYGKRLLLDTFHLNGSIPQWATLTGLQNYTLYKCYAFHFGLLDGKVKFHVMSSYGLRNSGSNVPSVEPKNFRGSSNLGKITVTWDAIPSQHREGYPFHYYVYYRPVGEVSWKSTSVKEDQLSYTLSGNIAGLFEFKVCGWTSAGIGPCSNVILMRVLLQGNQVDILHGMSFHTSLQFTHRKLIGHTHSAFQVTTLEACFHKCLKCQEASGGACKCLSFNMKHLEAGESGRCEINTVSADNTPQDLIAFEGYQHYSVVFSSLPTSPVKQGP